LLASHAQAPHLRMLQKELATEVTSRVHSEHDCRMAAEASEILFGKGSGDQLQALDEKYFLEVFEGVPSPRIARSELEAGIPVIELLSDKTQVFPSRGEARKMLQQGGVMINREKVSDTLQVNASALMRNKYLLVQKGKKNYFLVVAE